MDRPPLPHAWVSFQQGQVTELGHQNPPAGTIDLGDVALLPGLVNAHTHLEFSRLSQPLGQSGGTLPDWIAAVLQYRIPSATGETDADDAMAARRQALQQGLDEAAAAGVRLIGDIASAPWPLPPLQANHPDVVAFAEVLGLQPDRQQQTWSAAEALLCAESDGVQPAISPHAPYSTGLPLIGRAVAWSQQHRAPLAMHVAESREELELVQTGQGPFRAILENVGAWQPELFPWPEGIDGLLHLLAQSHRGLIVHGNYLDQDQVGYLASQPHLSVVYCPRTHDYFRHSLHPVGQLLEAGVRVALGTDSRASNPDLDVWNEVRFLAERRSDLNPEALVRMVTIDAADALGRGDCGRLQIGARPGLVAFPSRADQLDELWETLCQTQPTPIASLDD